MRSSQSSCCGGDSMNVDRRWLLGFLVIVFGGAGLTLVYWPLVVVAAVIGGYLMEHGKWVLSALSALVAGCLAWSLLFVRYALTGYLGMVNHFINAVAGVPALPLTLLIGGVLALLGALIGMTLRKLIK